LVRFIFWGAGLQVIASKVPQLAVEVSPRQRPPRVTVVSAQSALAGSPGSAGLQLRVAAITAGQIVVSAGSLDTSQDFASNVDRVLVVNYGLPVNADRYNAVQQTQLVTLRLFWGGSRLLEEPLQHLHSATASAKVALYD